MQSLQLSQQQPVSASNVYGISTEVIPVAVVPAPSFQESPSVAVAAFPISTPGNLGMVRFVLRMPSLCDVSPLVAAGSRERRVYKRRQHRAGPTGLARRRVCSSGGDVLRHLCALLQHG